MEDQVTHVWLFVGSWMQQNPARSQRTLRLALAWRSATPSTPNSCEDATGLCPLAKLLGYMIVRRML